MKRLLVLPLVLFVLATSTALPRTSATTSTRAPTSRGSRPISGSSSRAPSHCRILADRQVKAAVDAELSTRGALEERVGHRGPVHRLSAGVGTGKDGSPRTVRMGLRSGLGRQLVRRRRRWHDDRADLHDLRRPIALDMSSAGAKQLVWRGNASKTMNPKASPRNRKRIFRRPLRRC